MDVLTLNRLLLIDGIVFIVSGIALLFSPTPQPGLVNFLDEVALRPLHETRRLLGAVFLGNGLLAAMIGWYVHDFGLLRLAGQARAITLALLLGTHAWQLWRGNWRANYLWGWMAAYSFFTIVYLALSL